MFKVVVAVLLCLGTGISCISQEVPKEVKLPFNITASPALIYAAAGHMHLMLNDYEMALEDYRRASFCAEHCDKDTAEAVQFLTLFGQVIAYDNLNIRDKCDQALSALILSEQDNDEEDEEDDDDFEFSLKEGDKYVQKMAEMTLQVFFLNEFYKNMHDMALRTPSDNVRETLISIIEAWDD